LTVSLTDRDDKGCEGVSSNDATVVHNVLWSDLAIFNDIRTDSGGKVFIVQD